MHIVNNKGDYVQMEPTTFLKVTQVADRYGVNRSTIWRWIKHGHFPKPKKISPGSSRWNKIDLEYWERSKNLREDK